METKLIFYFIALLGVLFHLAMKYRDSLTKKETFNVKYHLMFSAFSLVTAWILVAFKPSITPFLPETFSSLLNNYLSWFMIAYFSDSVWKNVESKGQSNLEIKE